MASSLELGGKFSSVGSSLELVLRLIAHGPLIPLAFPIDAKHAMQSVCQPPQSVIVSRRFSPVNVEAIPSVCQSLSVSQVRSVSQSGSPFVNEPVSKSCSQSGSQAVSHELEY